jgi:hypothetical protein
MSDGVAVLLEPPLPEIVVVLESPLPEIEVILESPNLPEITVVVEPPLPEIAVILEPPLPDISVTVSEVGLVGPRGPRGFPGPGGSGVLSVFEYQMPHAQTTAIIDHTLGRDPVAVQVFDGDQLCDEYGVVFTRPGEQVTVGFDVSVAAFIRLL